MREMSLKEINGGRENIRRETNWETSGTAGVLGTAPPQTLPYFKLMNEKLVERKFFVINMKAENGREAACAELMGCIRRGNLAVHWEEQGRCDGLAYYLSNWIARQNLLTVFCYSLGNQFQLNGTFVLCSIWPVSCDSRKYKICLKTSDTLFLGGVYIDIYCACPFLLVSSELRI
jgi:hypothetical protein